MGFLTGKLQFILHAVQGLVGAYAGVKLAIMGYYYMTKNRQKLEEAQDGIKNIMIGVFLVIGAAQIVSWLTS